MKLIGKGAFTRCYLKPDGKTVQLVSCDPVKECMAFGWVPSGGLFPEIRSTGEQGVYEMDYIPVERSLKSSLTVEDWRLYQYLRAMLEGLAMPANRYDGYFVLNKAINALIDQQRNPEVRHDYIVDQLEELLEGLDGITNCGSDVWMEVSPRNVRAVGGRLVLLDCFFSIGKLFEVRRNAHN